MEAVEINVSGIDLTDVDLTDANWPEVLAGAVWDEATRWPSELHVWIASGSEQIELGVYRVRSGTERD